jgi:hypothetical protein
MFFYYYIFLLFGGIVIVLYVTATAVASVCYLASFLMVLLIFLPIIVAVILYRTRLFEIYIAKRIIGYSERILRLDGKEDKWWGDGVADRDLIRKRLEAYKKEKPQKVVPVVSSAHNGLDKYEKEREALSRRQTELYGKK